MSRRSIRANDAPMHRYVVYHRHPPSDCAASFAAWNGFNSELRRKPAPSTCAYGGHEIWWTVAASHEREALAMLPRFIADRSLTFRIADVEIP